MADRFIVENLQRLPMFKDLQPAEVERLAEFAQVIRFEQGELVFREGETSQGMFFVISGKAALLQRQPDGTHKQFAIVGANQYLNEDALRGPKIETATLYVLEPMILLFLHRDNYQAFVRELADSRDKIPVNTGGNIPAGANIPLRHNEMTRQRRQPPPQQNQPAQSTASNTSQGNNAAINPPAQSPDPRLTPHLQRYGVPSSAKPDLTPGVTSEENVVASDSVLEMPVSPDRRTFEGKRPTEDIIYMTRRHKWAVFRQIWKPAIVFFLLIVVALLIEVALIRVTLTGLAFVLPGLLMIYIILEWRNDWLIITDERILHIEKNILTVNTVVSDIPIRSVQNVKAEVSQNVITRLLGVGEVEINTAGGRGNIQMDAIPDVDNIKEYVFQERTKVVQREESERQRKMINAELDRIMGNEEQIPQAPEPRPEPQHPVGPQSVLDTRYYDEKGNIVYRHHWISWVQHVFVPGVTFVGVLGFMILSLFIPALAPVEGMLLIVLFFVLIVSGLWFYYADWDWRNDLIILSDNMITIIHRRPLWLQYEDDQVLLDRIDNTIANTGGPIRTLLGYGDVKILLVGDEAPKIFSRVPRPRAMREEISQFQANARRAAQDAADRRHLSATLESIYSYHQRYGSNPPPEGDQAQHPQNPTQPNTPMHG